MKQLTHSDIDVFKSKLRIYKKAIDADIALYSKQLQQSTLQEYGAHARLGADTFLDILGRGGKRIRGALTMVGYEMSDGRDTAMILQAARAIEMIHAYILMVDDFQDRSSLRRSDKTAHVLLADYHQQHHLAGDSDHFGASIAWNAALVGNHLAQTILANLNVDPSLRTQVLNMVNRTMITTGHGQTSDIINEVSLSVDEEAVDRMMEWKTANYTILNPLQVGMILAGADNKDIEAITPYARHIGRAFQITDDIIGSFGSEEQLGKSPMDDIREGKRTLLTVYALNHTTSGDKNFLIQVLGNSHLKPAEFERCKEILVKSGAVDYAKRQAEVHAKAARRIFSKEKTNWSAAGVQFLRGFAQYILQRQS